MYIVGRRMSRTFMNKSITPFNPILESILQKHPKFNSFLSEKQRDYFIWASYNIFKNRFLHSDEEGANCLFYQRRKGVFVPLKEFHNKNAMLGWFVCVAESDYAESKAAAWKLSEDASTSFMDVIDGYLKNKTNLVQMVKMAKVLKKHPTGIRKLTKERNQTVFTNLKVCSEVHVNVEKLLNLYHNKTWEHDLEIKTQIFDLLSNCYYKNGKITLPQVYVQHKSGRLYLDGTSLQNVKKEIRRAAISGYEYDIENAHYSIFYQLCQRFGIELPTIKKYIENKLEVRKSIAQEIGFSVSDVKTILISLIYGAGLNKPEIVDDEERKKQRALFHLFGDEGVSKLMGSSMIRYIYKEISLGRSVLVKNHKDLNRCQGDGIYNCFDFYKESETDAASLSHILQGWEAMFLKITTENIKSEPILLQHDGLTMGSEEDFEAIVKKIFTETGFHVKFSCHKF